MPSAYATDGAVRAAVRVGGTLYVGGEFDRVAARTGSAVIVSAGGALQHVAAEVAGGSVRAAVADGTGGWYVGGSFSTVGGIARPGLARLHGDGSLDPSFAPPPLGRVQSLALAGGTLYVGGTDPTSAPQGTPVLRALDAASGSDRGISYAPPAGATAVAAISVSGTRLTAAYGEAGVTAYDAASGATLWKRAVAAAEGLDSGAVVLAPTAGGRLLVGGEFVDAGGSGLESLDAATGMPVGPVLAAPSGVVGVVVRGTVAYLARQPQHGGVGGLAALDLASGTRLPDPAAIRTASAIALDGSTLLVADARQGRGGLRVYTLDLTAASATLVPASPPFTAPIAVLAPQGSAVLVGGTFAGAGGASRAGLAAFDVRSGDLLPWRPAVDGGVDALARSGSTIYVGGDFSHVSGVPRPGLAAVGSSGRGRLLSWRPRMKAADSRATVSAVAVAAGRVFAGGSDLALPGSARPASLVAFSAATGAPEPFRPRSSADVNALAVRRRTLLVATGVSTGGVTALPLRGDGRRAAWSRRTDGAVLALAVEGSTVYAGGAFSRADGHARQHLAAFALDRAGALLPIAPAVPVEVQSLVALGREIVYGGMAVEGASSERLGAISGDGLLEPWHVDVGNSDLNGAGVRTAALYEGGVSALARLPGGLFAGGWFTWLGAPGAQAAGGIAFLHSG